MNSRVTNKSSQRTHHTSLPAKGSFAYTVLMKLYSMVSGGGGDGGGDGSYDPFRVPTISVPSILTLWSSAPESKDAHCSVDQKITEMCEKGILREVRDGYTFGTPPSHYHQLLGRYSAGV